MRQYSQFGDISNIRLQDKIALEFQRFRKFDSALATALGLTSSLKPEASLMLELYQADQEGKSLTVTMLGLLDGIAPTTTLRYIDLLAKNGALQRSAHETDNRMRYVEITPPAKLAIHEAIQSLAD